MFDAKLFGVSSLCYLISMVVYIVFLIFKKDILGKVATAIVYIGFTLHTIAFLYRWYYVHSNFSLSFFQSIPITNLYESLLFFAWCIILGNIFLEKVIKTKVFGVFLMAIAGMSIAIIDAVGATSTVQPILPSLKSNWLLAHASLSFVAYAAFSLSFGASILNLSVQFTNKKSKLYLFWTFGFAIFIYILIILLANYCSIYLIKMFSADVVAFGFLKDLTLLEKVLLVAGFIFTYFAVWTIGDKFKNLISSFNIGTDVLEKIEYKMISIGFAIFTVGGLIFGAIWAEVSWGRYWAWDPKETWAFITWLVYALYLHMRIIKKYSGAKSSTIAIIGFIVTIFTYIGVNLIMPGLHSYGSV